MGDARGLFWISGVLAVIAVQMIKQFGSSIGIPFAHDLLLRPGPPGIIAAAIGVVALWGLLALGLRFLLSQRDRRVIGAAKKLVDGLPDGIPSGALEFRLAEDVANYENSLLQRRFKLLDSLDRRASTEHAMFLVSGQSGLDAARTQNAYLPLRALVWSLPAFGFIGTAMEMARSVGGLGTSLARTQSYNDLRDQLVSHTIPPLAGAFDLTLLALGSSVVCFVLLTLAHAREERILYDADGLALRLLAKLEAGESSAARSIGSGIEGLQHVLVTLTERLEAVRESLDEMAQGARLRQAAQMIGAIDGRLQTIEGAMARIVAEMGRDLVISRR